MSSAPATSSSNRRGRARSDDRDSLIGDAAGGGCGLFSPEPQESAAERRFRKNEEGFEMNFAAAMDDYEEEEPWNLEMDEEDNLVIDVAYAHWRGVEYYSKNYLLEEGEGAAEGGKEGDRNVLDNIASAVEENKAATTVGDDNVGQDGGKKKSVVVGGKQDDQQGSSSSSSSSVKNVVNIGGRSDSITRSTTAAPKGKFPANADGNEELAESIRGIELKRLRELKISSATCKNTATTVEVAEAARVEQDHCVLQQESKDVEMAPAFDDAKMISKSSCTREVVASSPAPAKRAGEEFNDLFPEDDPEMEEMRSRTRVKNKKLQRQGSTLAGNNKNRTPARSPGLSRSEVHKRLERSEKRTPARRRIDMDDMFAPVPSKDVDRLKIKHMFRLSWLFLRASAENEDQDNYTKCGSARKVTSVDYDEENLCVEINFGPQTALRKQPSGIGEKDVPFVAESNPLSPTAGKRKGTGTCPSAQQSPEGPPLKKQALNPKTPLATPVRGGGSAMSAERIVLSSARRDAWGEQEPSLTVVFLAKIDFQIFKESMTSKKNPFKDPSSNHYLAPATFEEEFRKKQTFMQEARNKQKARTRVLVRGHSRKGHRVAPHYRRILTNQDYKSKSTWLDLFE
ncbi:unnamed protein product [Amoebophrya sp. A120]|nr:unnamed protein product [Amoebophrya sp. A120]|eukprot:GSA120T00011471001.1